MFNSIAFLALGRARHRQLLDEAATRRARRNLRAGRRAAGRNRPAPGTGVGRPLVDPA